MRGRIEAIQQRSKDKPTPGLPSTYVGVAGERADRPDEAAAVRTVEEVLGGQVIEAQTQQ